MTPGRPRYGVRRPDGRWLTIHLNGSPVSWETEAQMLTPQRRNAEKLARDSRQAGASVVVLCRGHYSFTPTDKAGFDRLGCLSHALSECPRDGVPK